MKNKKIIPILSIIAILGIIIAIKVISDFRKETKINNEVEEIILLLQENELNEDKTNEILNRTIIKKGKYNKVEQGIKTYYKEIYNNLNNYNFLVSDDNFSYYLTSSNIKSDRPTFVKSKNNLITAKVQITDNYNKLITSLTSDKLKQNIINKEEYKLYYKELFLNLTNKISTEEFINIQKKKYDNSISKINIYDDIFNFLITNKGLWQIQKEEIVFEDITLYEEYLSKIKELKEVNKN